MGPVSLTWVRRPDNFFLYFPKDCLIRLKSWFLNPFVIKSENHLGEAENHVSVQNNHLAEALGHLVKLENHLTEPENHLAEPENHLAETVDRQRTTK